MFNKNNFNQTYYAVLCDIMKRSGFKQEFDARQIKLIKKLLKSTDIDTDDSDICAGVSDWLNLLFGSNKKVKRKLSKIKEEADDLELINKIEGLITFISEKYTQDELDYKIDHHVVIADNIFQQIAIRRDINYLEYFLIKEYLPEDIVSVAYTGNVGEFQELSRDQLVEFFVADKFYKLKNTQKLELLQAVVNDYCKANGVNSCRIELADLPCSEKFVCYGEYMPAQAKILLNKQIFDMLDDAKYCKNQYLPMRILSTVVHEAQHRVQFEKLENINKTEREQIVADSINKDKKYQSHNKYLIEPEELDARECTIEYIKECARTTESQAFSKYLNTLVLEERKNSKSEAPISLQQYFPNIYGKYAVTRGHNLSASHAEFKSLLQQKLSENHEKTRI